MDFSLRRILSIGMLTVLALIAAEAKQPGQKSSGTFDVNSLDSWSKKLYQSQVADTAKIRMSDIDNFKNINDKFGHVQGDRVLREIALRIVQVVRKSDTVARYGVARS